MRAVTEGFRLGGYTFTAYKKRRATTRRREPSEVVVLSPSARKKEIVAGLRTGPGGRRGGGHDPRLGEHAARRLHPAELRRRVEAAVKDVGKGRGPKVTIKVRDEEELRELGCGGILGVGLGSAAPPRLVELTWSPRKPVAHLALVGKGITFDSGGLTIKPGASMNDMKSECGLSGAPTMTIWPRTRTTSTSV